MFYATHGGKYSGGYIYVIDCSRLAALGVVAYEVNAIVPNPSVPEDEEVILVAHRGGAMPRELVSEIRRIDA